VRRKSASRGLEFTIDLGLYIGVLRRHRLLVAVGCAVALALALLSYVRVSADGLAYRNPEIWSNVATLGLTTPDSPEWRWTIPPTAQSQPLSGLVDQYAAYATSDPVIRALQKQRLLPMRAAKSAGGAITATAVPSALNGQPTPMLSITGMSTSPVEATRLTIAATDAFINYARARQDAAKIPENQRIELRIIKRVSVPTLTAPRSKTPLIIVLLAGLSATVAAAFVRDNMQRSRRKQRQPEPDSNLDPLVMQVEPTLLNGSESLDGAAEHGSHSGTGEAGGGRAEIPNITHTRRSARSSR
jgi:hypothetical protein